MTMAVAIGILTVLAFVGMASSLNRYSGRRFL